MGSHQVQDQKDSWLPGINGNMIDRNGKICMKNADLLGNFTNNTFLLQSNSGAYQDT